MSASASLPWYDEFGGFIWNAATGTLTQAQKDALIAQQAASVTAAAGGSSDPTAIAAQASQDVTAALTLNNADPSQASLFNNPGLDSLFQKASWVVAVVAIAAFLYFALEARAAFKK